jgi:hypothetical protein
MTVATGAGSVTPTSASTGNSPSSTGGGGNGGGGGGGLATGPKITIGVVVGILGLVVVGFLIWWYRFRTKTHQPDHGTTMTNLQTNRNREDRSGIWDPGDYDLRSRSTDDSMSSSVSRPYYGFAR